MPAPKTGPLTRDELASVWKSVTDPEYSRSFIERGEGQGYEAHTQAMVQFERVSRGVDRSTQALYVKPWSGQTAEPASGAVRSLVTLKFTRSSNFTQTVILSVGTMVEEVAVDFSPNGGELVTTGRRYLLASTIGFVAGEQGPIEVQAFADREGDGFDNPLPGTLSSIVQMGVDLQNSRASVVLDGNVHALVMQPDPDVITHAQIGQYMIFTSGANQGQIRRIVGIIPPDPIEPVDGGQALLEATQIFRIASITGTFLPGETITQASTSASSTFIWRSGNRFVSQRQSGDFVTGSVVVGQISGASVTFDSIEQAADLIAETNTASWRVMGWGEFGIAVTNEQSPSGGRAATLDEIGYERMVYRANGEGDESYRRRVANFADLVSPKAILRAANRVLVPYGYEAQLFEVGYPEFRGFFYDGDPTSTDPAIAFAYDLDFNFQPSQRLMLMLNYTEFRAFFLLGVPKLPLGEFGFGFDEGGYPFFDSAPYLSFFDGYPATAAQIYKAVWQAVDGARAGGVGFDLLLPLPPPPPPS